MLFKITRRANSGCVHLWLNEKILLEASYIYRYDSPRLLLEAMCDLLENKGKKMWICWPDEPRAYAMSLDRVDDTLYVEVFETARDRESDDFTYYDKCDISEHTTDSIYQTSENLYKAGKMLRNAFGLYRTGDSRKLYDSCHWMFPEEAYERLKALLREASKNPGKEPDLLANGYLEGSSAWNMTEAHDSILPIWSDKLLPDEVIDRVMDYYTIRSRADFLFYYYECDIKSKFGMGNREYSRYKDSILSKLNTGVSLTKVENDILEKLTNRSEKRYFPYDMSRSHIIKAIRQAYEDAAKTDNRYYPTPRDEYNIMGQSVFEAVLYQGKTSNGMIIRFWFNFDEMEIKTAYPKPT